MWHIKLSRTFLLTYCFTLDFHFLLHVKVSFYAIDLTFIKISSTLHIISYVKCLCDPNWIHENYQSSMTVSSYIRLQNLVSNVLSGRTSGQWQLQLAQNNEDPQLKLTGRWPMETAQWCKLENRESRLENRSHL